MSKNDYRITVIADDRERKSDVIQFLSETSEELQSIEGIGENIADRIKWVVSEQMKPYGGIDEFPI